MAVATAPTPVPALYVDTCAVLDIVRLPMRARAPIRELTGLRNILDAVRGGRASLHMSDLIPAEFGRHHADVMEEVQRHLRRIRDESAVVHDCADHLALGEIDWNVDPIALTELLSEHAREVLGAATVLATTDQDKLDAMERQVASLRPGRRGKDCIGDCMITTSMLRAARSQPARTIFLSSNVRDYSDDEKSSRIHGDLKLVFEELNITFATNWEWAARLVSGQSNGSGRASKRRPLGRQSRVRSHDVDALS
jgi:hypothetical protein